MRKIIHVDMDAFFASVEQLDNPSLRGKPIAVGGSPTGRGVLATASYEARAYGLKSAMPSATAIRLCPHVIFVKGRFERYKEISAQIRDIFSRFTDLVEPLSLDEAYLDVSENKVNNPSGTLIAQEIRRLIKKETGLTASAGVSFNKFLAKQASDINKPDGLCVITPDQAEQFLRELPIHKFHGIGKVTAQKMKDLGIHNGEDLLSWSEIDLSLKFGKMGRYYFNIVRGIDDREVEPERIRKSVGAERTFSSDLTIESEIYEALEMIAEKVVERLKRIPTQGKTITLKVRYSSFETITRSLTLSEFTNDKTRILETIFELIRDTDAHEQPIRLLGIALSNLNLAPKGWGTQLDLPFEPIPKQGSSL